jgi:RNA polymerase sigma factor (sigma-70 family)
MKLEIDSYFEPDIAWMGELNRQGLKLERMTSVFPSSTTHLICSLWRGQDYVSGIVLTLVIAGRELTARAQHSSPVQATRRAFEDLGQQVAALIEERREEGFWLRTSRDRFAHERVQAVDTPSTRSEAAVSVDRELGELYNFVRREIAMAQADGELKRAELTVAEIVDEVALTALEEFDDRPSDLDFRSWLFQIALDVMKRRIREIGKARKAIDLTALVDEPGRLEDEVFDFYQPDNQLCLSDLIPDGRLPTPEETVAAAELQQHINRELARLPRRWREAFMLYSIEGLTLEEVARVTRHPVDVTRRAIELARELLRVGLAEAGIKSGEQEMRKEAAA